MWYFSKNKIPAWIDSLTMRAEIVSEARTGALNREVILMLIDQDLSSFFPQNFNNIL